ncbi:MAG: NAD(P)-dependent glycerol-3-phosphate dehydrogenase [Saprospiraceae bacterium]|nr:NAD(P)-dependent glycerol-3-phosphate dehydrogenase [Saprospiraceae bacterium]
MPNSFQKAAVIGAGSFGTSLAKLLAYNADVLIYTRKDDVVQKINQTHNHFGIELSPRIVASSNLEQIAEECQVLFPVIPSEHFRSLMRSLAIYVRPYHIMIHGTKGLDLVGALDVADITRLTKQDVYTMSEVIEQETSVVRTGCLSGPNLSNEILHGQPTATLLASPFDEVIQIGQELLSSKQFFVFGSHDLKGAELAGALKNIVALGSGMLAGVGMGKNMQAMLITRGLSEMIYFGKAMGAEVQSFLGTAGIGDLIATATSEDSRNYTFGKRMGQGETLHYISETSEELAEGIRTLKIIYPLMKNYRINAPITQVLYKIVFEDFNIHRAIDFLMNYPYSIDVDYL